MMGSRYLFCFYNFVFFISCSLS
uniref:Uncharacterized protein n=1 Tax=Rhizophora mucronata TaxID=61149 RepID=A0A2P2N9T8_RHIMU